MAVTDIDFGSGANTNTGDTLPAALGKLEAGWKSAAAAAEDAQEAAAAAGASATSAKLAYVEMLNGGTLTTAHLGKQIIAGGPITIPAATATGFENGHAFAIRFVGNGSLTGGITANGLLAGTSVLALRRGSQWDAFVSGTTSSGTSPTPSPGPSPTPTPTTYEATWMIVTIASDNGDYANLKDWKQYSDNDGNNLIATSGNTFDGNGQFNDPSLAFDNDAGSSYTLGTLNSSTPTRWVGRKYATPQRPELGSIVRDGPSGQSYTIYVGAWANRGTTNGVAIFTGILNPTGDPIIQDYTYPQGA